MLLAISIARIAGRSRYFALFFSDLRDRLERIPGVASAGAVSRAPLAGTASRLANITVDGHLAENRLRHCVRHARVISNHAHSRIAGRDFDDAIDWAPSAS